MTWEKVQQDFILKDIPSFTLQHTFLPLPQPWTPLAALSDLQISAFGIPQPQPHQGDRTELRETPKNAQPGSTACRALLLQTSNILLSDLAGNWEETQRILIETEMGFLNEKHQQKPGPESNIQLQEVKEHLLLALKTEGKVAREDLQVQRYLR